MRKVVLIVLIALASIFSFYLYSHGLGNIKSISELNAKRDVYEAKVEKLESQRELYNKNDEALTIALSNYKTNKENYESMASISSSNEDKNVGLGDYYNLEYLWTILGTHSRKEGVKLGILCTTSPTESDSKDYIYANINFTVIGEYRPISEFIEKIEEDEKLEFQISSFKLVPYERMADDDPIEVANYLKATFTVRDVKLSADTLELINNKVEDSPENQQNLTENKVEE